jgi:DNA-binding response OmpR family regulator
MEDAMQKETILVVEDDVDILNLLRFNLEAAGYDVLLSTDGYEGMNLARKRRPDMIILDIMLPGIDGFEVCKDLKRSKETEGIPVIMLTARGEEVDRIVGLELGADDYVVKPFSPRELMLRVKAILKRSVPGETDAQRPLWKKEGLSVDMEAHRVMVDEVDIELTATEFKLLVELVHRQGRVLTRDQLLNRVWGYEFEGYARTVDTHIRRLRQKLGPYAGFVETVRGVGYRFRE